MKTKKKNRQNNYYAQRTQEKERPKAHGKEANKNYKTIPIPCPPTHTLM